MSGLGCDGEAKHLLVTTAGSAESISRHERDQDRQQERNAARRQRNELEQTIDLERQRIRQNSWHEPLDQQPIGG